MTAELKVLPFPYGTSNSFRVLIPSLGAYLSLAIPNRPVVDAVGSAMLTGRLPSGAICGLGVPFYLDDKNCFNDPPELLTEELNYNEVAELVQGVMRLLIAQYDRPELRHPFLMSEDYMPHMSELVTIRISDERGHCAKEYIPPNDMITSYFASYFPGSIDPRPGEVLGELHTRLSLLPKDEPA